MNDADKARLAALEREYAQSCKPSVWMGVRANTVKMPPDRIAELLVLRAVAKAEDV